MKMLKIFLVLSILAPVNLFAQTKREDRITQERTRSWQYESVCFQSGGAGSSYLVQVTSYVADLKQALPQAKKNAIHAVLFKGIAGNNLGCSTKEPLIPNGVYEDNFQYFEDFFYNTEVYNQFATVPSGTSEPGTEKLQRKMFKVPFVVSVNVETLREKLEFDKILEPLGDGLEAAGGPKPIIMVFPSDIWLNQNGYMKTIDNQGATIYVPDYQAALLNPELGTAIRTLEDLLGERGYNAVKLSEEISKLAEDDAIANAVEGRYGGASESSVLEDILAVARPDIRWDVTFTKNTNGIQNWIDYGIEAIDAYTGKRFAGADGTGPKTMSASTSELLRQAVADKMDDFLSEHQDYFNEINEKGREISLDIRRFDSFEYYFNDDVEFKGRELELQALIRGFLGSIARDKAFNFNATENKIIVKQLRIDLAEEVEDLFGEGMITEPLDASKFAGKLSTFIKKQFSYPSKVVSKGVGGAIIYIGEK
ncbi:MAG: DUF6175 family protein [Flavobacteriales bacterium]|tara:strand:+ start:1826 stop:3268 length:1443 start_codon:yes stop_codon:yes gene_type:complete